MMSVDMLCAGCTKIGDRRSSKDVKAGKVDKVGKVARAMVQKTRE